VDRDHAAVAGQADLFTLSSDLATSLPTKRATALLEEVLFFPPSRNRMMHPISDKTNEGRFRCSTAAIRPET